MSKLNFSVVLKMAIDQFKKGAIDVQSQLRRIQTQAMGMAAALGLGGLGLKNLVQNFIKTARETEKARVSLKNVSDTSEIFLNNQKFLINLSKEYGLNLNNLTGEFAKYTAAASAAGVSLDEQQKIYTSLTRAIKAFGLDSTEANLSFKALTQMMGKGKVTSEELRLQLGEKIPIAVEAMARAVGGSVADLEKAMKAGTVSSAEYLGKFADELNKMIPNVETDTLESSLTRIENIFRDLGEKLNIGKHYKSMVDGFGQMLQSMADNLSLFVSGAIGLIGGKLFGGIAKFYTKTKESYLKLATERNLLLVNQSVAEGEALQSSLQRMEAEKALETEKARYKMKMGRITFQDQKSLQRAEKTLLLAQAREQKDIAFAAAAQQKAAAASSGSVWRYAWTSFKASALGAIATVRTALLSIVPMAVISGITYIISGLIQTRKESEKINKAFTEYQNGVNAAGNSISKEIIQMESLRKILEDTKTNAEERRQAEKELSDILGIQIDKNSDLLALTEERARVLKEMAKIEAAQQAYGAASEENSQLAAKYAGGDVKKLEEMANNYMEVIGKNVFKKGSTLEKMSKENDLPYRFMNNPLDIGAAGKEQVWGFGKDLERAASNAKIMADASERLPGLIKNTLSTKKPPAGDPKPPRDPEDKETRLQKAERRYVEELQEITNLHESGVTKEDEKNRAIDELNNAIYREIGAIEGASAPFNETFQKAKQGVENPLYKEPAKTVSLPVEGSRDTLFDYKKDNIEKLEELRDLKADYISELKRISEEDFAGITDIINAEADKLQGIDDMINAGKIKKDVVLISA